MYSFATGKQQEKEARSTASKALKMPASVRFIEDEDEAGKDLAFDSNMIQRIEKARYDQRVLRAAVGGNRRGFGYGGGRGGRGRGDRARFFQKRQPRLEFPINTGTNDGVQPPVGLSMDIQISTNHQQVEHQENYRIPSDGIAPGGRL